MTEKLYYSDPYIKEAKANIIDIIEENGKIEIVLDKTIFYPEGGGQPSDIGYIGDIPVVHVRIKDSVIYHEVTEKPETKEVICKLDFKRRFDHMQQHSGEHVLAGTFYRLFGGNNKGFRLGENYVTIDIDIKDMTDEIIEEAEREANKSIYEDIEVEAIFSENGNIEGIPVRKEVSVDKNIRVIKMGNVDCCACGGTHVKRTGEIGIIKILKTEAYKGMTRVYFNCGERALKDYEQKNNIIKALKKIYSSEEDLIIDKVLRQKSELDEVKKSLSLMKKKIAEIIAQSADIKDNKYFFMYDDLDFETLLLMEDILKEKTDSLVLGSLIDKRITANTKDIDFNMGRFFKDNINDYRGKGGGPKDKAQGVFDDEQGLKDFAELLKSKI